MVQVCGWTGKQVLGKKNDGSDDDAAAVA